jgi:predicted unusual protein kinase regulating ubiquinone biosynthesis (AarF/ABC1/UbiB family)
MEYYEIGSILNYKPDRIEEIISILNQVICSMVLAFEKFGFIHGDLHPGNVLIKKTERDKIKYKYNNMESEIKMNGIQILIFDFDRSNFSADFGMLLNEILTFINLYDSYLLESKILKVNNISITPLRTLKQELYKVTNINGLKNIIGD